MLAHQRREQVAGGHAVGDGDAHHAPHIGIHRRLPKLGRIHLAQALVVLQVHAAARFVEHPRQRLRERRHGAPPFTALDIGAVFDEVAEHRRQALDVVVFRGDEELVVENGGSGDAVLAPGGPRAVDLVLAVLFEFEDVLALRQRLLVAHQPLLHPLAVREVLGRHRRRVEQRHRQGDGINAVERVEPPLDVQIVPRRALEIGAVDGRRIRVDVQRRAFQGGLQEVAVELVVVLHVAFLATLLHLVERRLRDVDVAAVDQLEHVAEKERQQQRANVRAVHVGVGHDDDAVVAELVDFEVAAADSAAERRDQGAHLRRREHLVEAGLLHVENLAAQGKDGLGAAVAPLLGRTARRIALHQEHLGEGRVLLLAVGELARQAGDVQGAFAARHLPCLAGRLPGARRVEHLGDHLARVLGAFVQVGREVARELLLHRWLHFARYQLVLGLGGELGIRHLHRHDRRQSLPRIVAGGRHLRLLGDAFAFDVAVQRARQRGAEASHVRAAVALGNVVGVGEDLLLEAVVPLHGHFHGNAVAAGGLEMEDLVQRFLVAVEELDEGAQAAFVVEAFAAAAAFVAQPNRHAGVQKRQFAQLLGQRLVLELDVGEGLRGRLEVALGAPRVGFSDHRERAVGNAVPIGLLVDVAVAAHGEPEHLRERVDHRGADAVQAARHLVGTAVELAPGVQGGEDHFGGGLAFFVVDVHRHAAAVVAHGDGFARVDDDVDLVAMAAQGFVDGVVDEFLHHVMQASAVVGVADVHARALAHGVEAAQHLDASGVVCRIRVGAGFFVVGHRQVYFRSFRKGIARTRQRNRTGQGIEGFRGAASATSAAPSRM